MTYLRADELDADIAALIADYDHRHTDAPYLIVDTNHPNRTPAVRDLRASEPVTVNEDRYPLPDSYRHVPITLPKDKRQKIPFDLEAYEATVARLRAEGYISMTEAAVISRKSLFMLRNDASTGLLKATDAIGYSRRGLSKPRYFVTLDELARHLEWCAAGRPRDDKYKQGRKSA